MLASKQNSLAITRYGEFGVTEYSTFKIPYENLNLLFRAKHKFVERGVYNLKRAAEKLQSLLPFDGRDKEMLAEVRLAFDEYRRSVKALQTIVAGSVEQQLQRVGAMRVRVKFVRELARRRSDPLEEWYRNLRRSDRLVIGQLQRCGFVVTARALAEHSGLAEHADLSVFEKAKEVEDALLHGDTTPLTEWINEHRSKLRRMNSKLEQALRVQETVELIRCGRKMDGLCYVRKHLSMATEDKEVRQLLGLIAVGTSTEVPAYLDLLSEGRWTRLANLFREQHAELFQLPAQSVFSMVLQCGLSAFKTPACAPEASDKCPVCQPTAYALAEGLPHAHIENSRLICSYTGEALNEHNIPLMLESGRVYGENAVRHLRVGNRVKCPRTNEWCDYGKTLRLFIL